MAEGPQTGVSAVQVLPRGTKTPSVVGNSTAGYVEQGVSAVVNRNSVGRSNTNTAPQATAMYNNTYNSGNVNVNAMAYNTGNLHNNYLPQQQQTNPYNNYQGQANNPYSSYNNNNYNQYNINYGGGYNGYQRDYNTFKPPTAYSSSTTGNNNNNSNEPNDGSVVDSALLAALRDSRERVALLRLEQVMIDFMNAPEGYLEVGGPYNSVVVSPNTSSKRFQSSANVATDTGGRQTSFQRCLLHRLADRFGIVRETGTILEGSIRLIKQKDSKIPKVLLLDHVEESNNNETAKGAETEAVTEGMTDMRVSQTSGPPAKDKTKRKMKIMKRNSSAESGNGQAKSTPKSRKSKNFSDKEKAYAEARARIFADEAANGATTTAAAAAAAATSTNSGQTQSAPASMAPSPSATPPPQPMGNPNAAATSVHKSASANNLSIPKRMSSSSLMGDNNNEDGLPPAAAQSGVSKATWRNRKEEENDPDFQRGSGLQTLVPVVAAAPTYNVPIAGNAYYYQAGPGAVPTASYGQPQHYYHGDYSNNNNNGNPGRGVGPGVGVGRGGRGFVSPRGYGYPQQQQQHYRNGGNNANDGDATDVTCLEEFPALR